VANLFGQRLGDGAIAVGVLVAHGRVGGGVTEAGHQVGERGAALGGQDGAGVSEGVECEIWPSRRVEPSLGTPRIPCCP
jgi:hypothetical protein